jgi:trk system potassium uptake protein
LSLPVATAEGSRADLVTALFTATSAVCVTGLIVVDTETYWSRFGQVAILVLIQIGGLGIMTLATLVAAMLSRRMGLRARLVAQAETKAMTAADIRRVIRNIVFFTLSCELVVAVVLAARFLIAYGQAPGQAIYGGVFHAVSAFNNAGFSIHADNLMRYVADPWINLVVAAAVITGGLGFPVIFELARSWRRPKTWTVLTRITVLTTVTLLVAGTIAIAAAEARNHQTLGPLTGGNKLVGAFFASTVARTAGFNTVDVAAWRPETLLIHDILMFIGGGSAGTAGGIKVTTFGLLAYVIWSEMRGQPDVTVGRRRISSTNQRQALAVALLGIGLVVPSALLLLVLSPFPFDVVLFEAVSAFATVGLSTGITDDLTTPAQLLLAVLMFVGRTGPLTLASALAVRERARRYRLPEERTVVG